MSFAELSIKRPIFITSLVLLSIALGIFSWSKLPVDLFPDVTFPVINVTITYKGASPEEIETLISKPLEEELSSLGGMKRLRSTNKEGVSVVICEFNLDVDIKYAEQQVRDRLSSARKKLPIDIDEPVVRRIDPSDQPIMTIALKADLPMAELYDLANLEIKPQFEQINNVGLVDIQGGRKREIHVLLNQRKLRDFEISATQVVARLKSAGENIPAGKIDEGIHETIVRTLAEFSSIEDIQNTIINFYGNDRTVAIRDLALVKEGLEEETTRAEISSTKALIFQIYRQTGANTIAVADKVEQILKKINRTYQNYRGHPEVVLARDGAKPIRANVEDVNESILLGIFLTIVVVFVFLGSFRSTLITGLALPNSLLGAFILMSICGFSINIMTLLALSLAVGLLIDDAIVVRENIFRHFELNEEPKQAAILGTKEVQLAVIATTLTVIAVFGPIAFLDGVVGQFFKQFGLTVCFAMIISLFDALTIAPMLSAYYAGIRKNHGGGDQQTHNRRKKIFSSLISHITSLFTSFGHKLNGSYEKILRFSIHKPNWVLFSACTLFFGSIYFAAKTPKTFLPPQDNGEFAVSIELPLGTSLDGTEEMAHKVDKTIFEIKEVAKTILTIGDGGPNKATFFVLLVPSHQRKLTTTDVKEKMRHKLSLFSSINPVVKDIDVAGVGQRPFTLDILGPDLTKLQKISENVYAILKKYPSLKDVDSSFRPGNPELQIILDQKRSVHLGVLPVLAGQELRTLLEGTVGAKLRRLGEEYDIRVKLEPQYQNFKTDFNKLFVTNINNNLISLPQFAHSVLTTGYASIDRVDRSRSIEIQADITPGGSGLGGAIQYTEKILKDEMKNLDNFRYVFLGQAENFKELLINMLIAGGLGILFIYLILSSLYESFILPLTIMLVLPLAASGAFFALWVSGESLDIFSMIGCLMLLGIATKNSILLVDYTVQRIKEHGDRNKALFEAGKTRLRPILMTSFALVAGMLPVALGLNEAAKQRTSLGVSVIGGVISSTLLSLVVIPAAFSYIDRFRIFSQKVVKKLFGT